MMIEIDTKLGSRYTFPWRKDMIGMSGVLTIIITSESVFANFVIVCLTVPRIIVSDNAVVNIAELQLDDGSENA